MTDYTPIDCSDYDYLEIACMDRYEIEVTHVAGSLAGVADGLETRKGEEFLCVRTGAQVVEAIRVDRILGLRVLSDPARFRRHRFRSSA
ncbi:MAG TPA: Rho-binding antiterminator [Woeseiaceae bacterium]|nr:Rho-binding antiterminator [Woeseiaceae bacterium]